MTAKFYKVGGVVRDRLLKRPVTDIDWVVVGASAEELLKLGYKPVGKDFPVFLHPDNAQEYALARTERKSGRGHAGFEFYAAPDVTLEQDLSRRDLTINAMAEGEQGELVDPFGGREDLEKGTLRHVSEAFIEDPLRVLRVARFAAQLDFSVAQETHELMCQMAASGELDTLSAERVQSELAKALGAEKPRRFVEVLRACGALKVVFPEVDALFGVPQTEKYHPEIDTGEHLLLVLDQIGTMHVDGSVAFAAFVHDLGKALTPEHELPGHPGHEEAGVPLVEAVCKRLRAPKRWRELAIAVCRWHLHCHRALELKPGTVLKLLDGMDAWRRPERFYGFLDACAADARGRAGMQDRPYPQVEFLRKAQEVGSAIDVQALVKAGLEGAAVGERLKQDRTRAIANIDRSVYQLRLDAGN